MTDDKPAGSLVQHRLPEIGRLAGTSHVGMYRFGANAPISAAVNLVEQQLRLNVKPLLTLRIHRPKRLEASATEGHLLDTDDVGALVCRLQTRHKPTDASSHHDDVVILRRCDLVGRNGVGDKGDRAARAGTSCLLHGNPGCLIGQLGDGRHRPLPLRSCRRRGSSRSSSQRQGSRGRTDNAGTAQEVATRYTRSLHSSSFDYRTLRNGLPCPLFTDKRSLHRKVSMQSR